MVRQVAVMNGHSSEIMKVAARAISQASAMRPCGCRASVAARAAAGSGWLSHQSSTFCVATYPGAMAFTRTPCAAYSSASDLVSPNSACLTTG
jgi:hypothetical protein